MTPTSEVAAVRWLLLTHYSKKRFTTDEVVTDVISWFGWEGDRPQYTELPLREGQEEPFLLKSKRTRHHVYRLVSYELMRMRDDEGRLFYHQDHRSLKNPEHFSRNISTPEEEINFGFYLQELGRNNVEEGKRIVRRGRKRLEKDESEAK